MVWRAAFGALTESKQIQDLIQVPGSVRKRSHTMRGKDECPGLPSSDFQHLSDFAVNGAVGLLDCVRESLGVGFLVERMRGIHIAPKMVSRAMGRGELTQEHVPGLRRHEPPEKLSVRGDPTQNVPAEPAKGF